MRQLPEPTYAEIWGANQGFNSGIDGHYDINNPRSFIEAIRAYRERCGVGLADAKRAIEEWRVTW